MKVRSLPGANRGKCTMQMTPMIDIVFQLLVFFLLTFKIVSSEGDFDVRMPRETTATGHVAEPLPPIIVRLVGDSGGELAEIRLNERNFGVRFDRLQEYLIGLMGVDSGPDSLQSQAEVELVCDYGLRYEHVIRAITAVSGFVDADGNVVKLVERIRFAPPRTT